MNSVFKMALKDIKLLLRDRLGAFFIIGFPILMGLFFGLIMGGPPSGGGGTMKLALVDQDQSEISAQFVKSFQDNESVEVELESLETARESVRKGQRVGMVVLPSGFGETAGIFWEPPPRILVGMDPSRSAEAAMVQGFVMEAIGQLVGQRFNNPRQFQPFVQDAVKQVQQAEDLGLVRRQALLTLFTSFDKLLDSIEDLQSDDEADDESPADGEASAGESGVNFQFADIQTLDVTRQIDPDSRQGQLSKLRSRWDISFPQAMIWGVLACVAGFAVSIARETTRGTMLRLQVAPVTRFQILTGKALACFLTVLGVIALLIALGIGLGLRPASFPKLLLAALSVAFCFVGIMMTMSVLGKTEESVGGIGWAVNMVMAMLGGGMIPVMFMPSFMQQLSVLSPVKWSILAMEGAIWRQFTLVELARPCGILVAVGLVGILVGTIILRRR